MQGFLVRAVVVGIGLWLASHFGLLMLTMREFLARHARTSRNFGRALSSDGRGRRLNDIVRLDHPFAHLYEPITKSFRAHALRRHTRTFEHQK